MSYKDYTVIAAGEGSVWMDGRKIRVPAKAVVKRPKSDKKELLGFDQELPQHTKTRRKALEFTLDFAEATPSLLAIIHNLTVDTTSTAILWRKPVTATIPASSAYEITLPAGKTAICNRSGTYALTVEYADAADGGLFTLVTGAPAAAGEVQYSTNKLVFHEDDKGKEINYDYLYTTLGGKAWYSTEDTKDPAAVYIEIVLEEEVRGDASDTVQTKYICLPEAYIEDPGELGKQSEDTTDFGKISISGTALAGSDGRDFELRVIDGEG